MRTNKFLATLVAATVIASGALAQPTVTLSIHLGGIGTSLSDPQDVSSLSALPSSAPQTITLDINDFGSSNFYYVQVTTRLRYANHDPNVTRGISIVNSYINLANTGLTIYTGWTIDESEYSDARKNVMSHLGGYSITDCADNQNLIDNSARAWEWPNAPGGPLAGVPAAVGKSVYAYPFTGTSSRPLYSFVIVVPKQVGVYQVAFDRVLSGGSPNTNPRVKTNILGLTNQQGQFYQFDLNTLNGTIEVVPEPASMIALGSGLVGLLALRRRRTN